MATKPIPSHKKPSQSLSPLRISSSLGLAEYQTNSHQHHHNNNNNYKNNTSNSRSDAQAVNIDERIPRSPETSSLPSAIPSPALVLTLPPASIRALKIPEIILLVQEQLDRPSLLISLRVATLWHQVGRHLIWHTVDWDNTLSSSMATAIEELMVKNAGRIRNLRCMFHSQGGISFVDSSKLLKGLVASAGGGSTRRGKGEVGKNTKKLRMLSLRGHFSLQSVASHVGGDSVNSNRTEETMALVPPLPPRYIPFCIPTLTHLEIRPTVNSSVDLHLILDTAVGLRTLVVDSHGSFVDSNNHNPSDDLIIPELDKHEQPVHETLMSLKIQHLKMSRQELESVAARCPNLVEFQSVCSPATLWRQPIGSQQQEQHIQQVQQQQQQQQQYVDSLQQQQPRSLVGALAKSCPKIQRFHVGLQQGGFHTDLVRDALTSFPQLVALGLPTTDCTTATMDVIKSCQLRHHSATSPSVLVSSLSSGTLMSAPSSSLAGGIRAAEGTVGLIMGAGAGAFLTSLTIMNVSSSEKVSLALHDFLCWTPYLKEFYAYNTTLYLEHMQPSRNGGEIVETQELNPGTVVAQPADTLSGHQDQYLSRRDSWSNSNNGGGDGAELMEGAYVRVSDHGHHDSPERSETENALRNSHADVTVSVSQSSIAEAHPAPPPTTTMTTPSPLSSALATVATTATGCGQQTRRQQWACTGLETLVVRFAHLPWRNSAEPPKRSKETFAFLTGLQKLKRLCIKEGLMLEAGREYDMLARLHGLEEVVFTTCYPIPIKAADMEWVVAPTTSSSSSSSSLLKKVVVRRQKANTVLDKEMTRWFDEQDCGVKLSFQLTDCCEEEYRFP
ncbi:hypothetical protein BGZ95_008920 [Linnemannia exigua]|uniref:Uncharacterized protein n=1 Tax=Linnemannia exigua TaxID=604196 RepID=A0AAD4DDM8_9FUNG|nr:hypothetical protein BGZ95_008920 [Linnemannia exigua]